MSRAPVTERIFIHETENGYDIVCRIPHEMSDERYLTRITFRRNGEIHAQLLLGRNVSRNPAAGTHFSALDSGDIIGVDWQDLAGRSGEFSRPFDGKAD